MENTTPKNPKSKRTNFWKKYGKETTWPDALAFISEVSHPPTESHCLSRPDKTQPFGPGNWEWRSREELMAQARNQRGTPKPRKPREETPQNRDEAVESKMEGILVEIANGRAERQATMFLDVSILDWLKWSAKNRDLVESAHRIAKKS